MDIYYHGTIKKGLKKLIPNRSVYSKLPFPCIYLTKNKVLATIYIWNRPYKWMNYGFKDEKPIITESFENALFEFYNGVDGYIYAVNGSFEENESVGIKYTKISKEPVDIIESYYIENVYIRLLEYEKAKDLIIRRYNELTERDIEIRARIVKEEIRQYNLKEDKENLLSQFIKEKFPEIWDKEIGKK
jgi:hypothetical protein